MSNKLLEALKEGQKLVRMYGPELQNIDPPRVLRRKRKIDVVSIDYKTLEERAMAMMSDEKFQAHALVQEIGSTCAHQSEDEAWQQECMICGTKACPWSEPLHYHHDGCPACPCVHKPDDNFAGSCMHPWHRMLKDQKQYLLDHATKNLPGWMAEALQKEGFVVPQFKG